MQNQSPAPVADAVEALRLAEELKALRRRRSGIVCGLLTAACCDKLDAEQDALIDRLASLHPQPAPAVAVEALPRDVLEALEWLDRLCEPGWYTDRLGPLNDWIKAHPLAARSAPAVAESQWISVEDRLPDVGDSVWIAVWAWNDPARGQRIYGRADYNGDEWINPQDDDAPRVWYTPTHWMPLPPAPPTVGSGSAQEGQAK